MTATTVLPLNIGVQRSVLSVNSPVSGSDEVEFSIQSDTILLTLWADTVATSLLVSCYGLTDTGKEVLLFSFPTLSSSTTSLLLKRASVTPSRVRIVATYTGATTFEVQARAIQAGLSNAKIVGAETFRVSTATVTTTPSILIPSTLTDRAGISLRNWSGTGILYISHSLATANDTDGYPIAAKEALAMDVSAGVAIYGVSSGPTLDIRMAENGG